MRGSGALRNLKPVDGKFVVLSIGMSNATLEFQEFRRETSRRARRRTLAHGRLPSPKAGLRVRDGRAAYDLSVHDRHRTDRRGAVGARRLAVVRADRRDGNPGGRRDQHRPEDEEELAPS
jgi:hypothetical protein